MNFKDISNKELQEKDKEIKAYKSYVEELKLERRMADKITDTTIESLREQLEELKPKEQVEKTGDWSEEEEDICFMCGGDAYHTNDEYCNQGKTKYEVWG
jgi:tyrosyl-tRNA synthetase